MPKKNTTFQTPASIARMLRPVATKPQGRKVWSIDLETVWIPFFTGSNVTGDTAIPHEALGAPLRLVKEKDGTIRFRDDGRPVLRVAPELAKAVADVRANIIAELVAFPQQVYKANPDGYKAEVEANLAAGKPINEKAAQDVAEALEKKAAEVVAQAEATLESAQHTETPAEQAGDKAAVAA